MTPSLIRVPVSYFPIVQVGITSPWLASLITLFFLLTNKTSLRAYLHSLGFCQICVKLSIQSTLKALLYRVKVSASSFYSLSVPTFLFSLFRNCNDFLERLKPLSSFPFYIVSFIYLSYLCMLTISFYIQLLLRFVQLHIPPFQNPCQSCSVFFFS